MIPSHGIDIDLLRAALRSRRPRERTPDGAWKHAAVAIVLRGSDPEVLLVRRAEHPTDPWSGHMAFPGGRKQESDRDLRETAMRETLEEVGLDLAAHAEPIGKLDDLPAIARGRPLGLVIAPYVFEARSELPAFALNGEIAEVLWAPLAPMISGENATSLDYPFQGTTYTFPGYAVGPHVVWGLTYQMLQMLFEVIRAER